jgi:hypothetical protein
MAFYWYFSRQSGFDIELTVYLRPVNRVSAFDEIPLWRMTNGGSQIFGYWKKGVVPLMQTSNFQVSFLY